MGEALYRKYRSKSLDEVVGQEHITTTLANALKQGRISHAYLFTGPRGVGKTSVARILAHEVNGLPYVDDAAHLDIIEIDAASNRRIDEIRDLRDKVNIAPTSSKYKVYIIDEVHMLTKEAFNALLKTLEEPPRHVIFILATTELHKLPETIISRTQRFNFKAADPAEATAHLASIAKKEGITIDNEALQLLAEHGRGSFRDSLSLLDQVSNSGETITTTDVATMLGIPPAGAVDTLLATIQSNDAQATVQRLEDLQAAGYNAPRIAEQLSQRLREQLLQNTAPNPRQTLTLLRLLIGVSASPQPNRLLELLILESILAQSPPPAAIQSKPAPQVIKTTPTPTAKPAAQEPVTKKEQPQAATTPKKLPKQALPLDAAAWDAALQALKQKNNTLYGIARMAQPHIDGSTVTLTYAFPFHQKRMDEKRNKEILQTIITEITGQAVTIENLVDTSMKAKPGKAPTPAVKQTPPPSANSATLRAVTDIFGGGEVES